MQLCLAIGSHELTALVDIGSTRNFISTTVTKRVGLHLEDSVIVANGDHVRCVALACDIATNITEEHMLVDCFAIPLDCYDVVLDVQFVRTLRPILWDFEGLRMAFWRDARRVLWHDLSAAPSVMPSYPGRHVVEASDMSAGHIRGHP